MVELMGPLCDHPTTRDEQSAGHQAATVSDMQMRLMITTVRDEAPFILEWIAYHRLIGFTDFLIYSNDCTDGTDAILDRLMSLGVVTHVPNARTGKKTVQWQALSRARDHEMTRRAEWIMVADLDEFLVIHPGDGHLDDLFTTVPDADGFAIPWRLFGNSGRLLFEPGLVIEQFTRAAPEDLIWPWRAIQFKSLFRRYQEFVRLGVHRPRIEPQALDKSKWVDGNGASFRLSEKTFHLDKKHKYGVAQINHYSVGSAESFLAKAARGRPNRMHLPIDLGYWVERNFNDVEDRRILRHVDAVRAEVISLLTDAELSELHEQGIVARRTRIVEQLRSEHSFTLFTHLAQSPGTVALSPEIQISFLRGGPLPREVGTPTGATS